MYEDLLNPTDPSALPPRMEARLQSVIFCPILRQFILLRAVCEATGEEDCLPRQAQDDHVQAFLALRANQCPEARAESLEELAYQPSVLN